MTPLNEIEVRVLGALLEKEITTPDYYPLSLNALIIACNQKSNRDPVMAVEEGVVRQALDSLNEKNLAGQVTSADSHVPKYAHRLQEVFNFDRREMAVLCVLLLRGPQTPGELRGRTERMYRFDDLGGVESALHHLMEREPSAGQAASHSTGRKQRVARAMKAKAAPLPGRKQRPNRPAGYRGRTRGESLRQRQGGQSPSPSRQGTREANAHPPAPGRPALPEWQPTATKPASSIPGE